MWHYLVKFEAMLFYPAFLVYALLSGISHSLRCGKCRRWLFDYRQSYTGRCNRCIEKAISTPTTHYDRIWKDVEGIVADHSPTQTAYIHKLVAKKVSQGRILDVGCGRGVLLYSLRGEDRELYGFDIAQSAMKLARTFNPEANFLVADARHIPYKSNSFDWIVCSEVIEHIEGDRGLRECYRLVKPGSLALFTVPSARGAANAYNPEHVHSFTFKSFASFLHQVGFEVVSGQKFGLYIPILSHLFNLMSIALKINLPFAGPLSIKVPEFLATNFLVVCRKPHEGKDENTASQIAS